jgi:hypothetical protein
MVWRNENEDDLRAKSKYFSQGLKEEKPIPESVS